MSPNLKKSLISLVSFVAISAIGYVTKNLANFDIPTNYLPLVAAGLAVAMHWLDELTGSPTPNSTLSTSAQK